MGYDEGLFGGLETPARLLQDFIEQALTLDKRMGARMVVSKLAIGREENSHFV